MYIKRDIIRIYWILYSNSWFHFLIEKTFNGTIKLLYYFNTILLSNLTAFDKLFKLLETLV